MRFRAESTATGSFDPNGLSRLDAELAGCGEIASLPVAEDPRIDPEIARFSSPESERSKRAATAGDQRNVQRFQREDLSYHTVPAPVASATATSSSNTELD